ncbi:hypothetical protein I8J29_24930 [Paenibacillus sp. MWE-103]|uniref:Uncharacterized protein n=1 Tax=Paenibacillus artemisiicola TaxID=1172618 RepID=A0ABS3WGH9_9BACL|nr:hypothetical protein [Paenibacillus artemisiicola]MBO7747436.1 hypothetical protein [Paenibacillus artemisiicola]
MDDLTGNSRRRQPPWTDTVAGGFSLSGMRHKRRYTAGIAALRLVALLVLLLASLLVSHLVPYLVRIRVSYPIEPSFAAIATISASAFVG